MTKRDQARPRISDRLFAWLIVAMVASAVLYFAFVTAFTR